MSDKEDDEVGLPKATVFKLISEMLPDDLAAAKDAKDIVVECCIEWIKLISTTANAACDASSKKTISPEHVIEALKTLGFEGFVPEVEESNEEFKRTAKDRVRKPPDTQGMTPEQLLELQQTLFQRSQGRMADEGEQP